MIEIKNKKIAIFTDIHFGKGLNNLVKLNQNDRFIDWFISKLILNGISDVIFLGDWFNSRSTIDVQTLNFSNRAIKKFNDNHIQLYMIIGNHDIYYATENVVNSLNQYESYDNVHIISKPQSFLLNKKIAFFAPWNTSLEDFVKNDVTFSHLEFNGALLDGVRSHSSGLNIEELGKKSSLIFNGHFHLGTEYETVKLDKIVNVGSCLQLNWGECDTEKHIIILDTETLTFDYVENDFSPKHNKIYYSKYKCGFYNDAELKSLVKGQYVQIVVEQSFSQNEITELSTLINMIGPLFPCQVKYIGNSSLQVNPNLSIVVNPNCDDLTYIEKFLDSIKSRLIADDINIDYLRSNYIRKYYDECRSE